MQGPEELDETLRKEADRRRLAERMEHFQSLTNIIVEKRNEAIEARAQSGIEEEWREAEEQYEGIDDANRHKMRGTWIKPHSMSGGLRRDGGQKSGSTPTLLPNITRPYTDAATARMADMLLPRTENNYAVDPTPIPELEAALEDDRPLIDGETGTALMRDATEEEREANASLTQVPMTVADKANEAMKIASDRSKACEKQFMDWHAESGFNQEVRKVIHDAGKYGVGALKGPVPVRRKAAKVVMQEGGARIEMMEKIAPASMRVSPWNCYPAPDCGENIHNGSYFIEHDELSRKKLRELKGLDYIDPEIDACLKEGPKSWMADETGRPADQSPSGKSLYDIWYFYGEIKRKDLGEIAPMHHGYAEGETGEDDEAEEYDIQCDDDVIYAQITMVNNRIIKVVVNPLESGEFPYDVYVWSERAGSWAGYGIPNAIRPAQKIVTAAIRKLLQNAGRSTSVIMGIKRDGMEPADGSWSIGNDDKVFWLTEDDGQSIRDRMNIWEFPSRQAELQNIFMLGMRMAEDITGMPMIMSGQLGSVPDRVGTVEILQNNSGVVPREKARSFDERLTEPHLKRYYQFLMIYSDNEEAKGDFQIVARGASVLVERALQAQTMGQVLPLVANPKNPYRVDPAKAFGEWWRAQHLDPAKVQYDDAEWQKMQEQSDPPPPQIAVAQIRAETDKLRIQKDVDRDTVYTQAEADRTQKEHEARLAELAIKERLALLEFALQEKLSLEDAKTKLADTALKLRTQKELSAATQALHPPTEPAGRAPNGQAFQR